MAEPITTTAIKEMLNAVISDDIKITIRRDEIISSSARISLEGKHSRYEQLVNHLDLGLAAGLVEHVSLLIIKTLQDLINKERNWEK